MHVAILYNGYISRDTGTSERVLQIANRLASLGVQLTLSGSQEHYGETTNSANLQLVTMPNRILKLPGILAWFARLVVSGLINRYDVIQVESFSLPRSLALFLLLHPLSRRSVIVFHDKYFEHDPRRSVVGKLSLALQRTLLILFDASITPGTSVREWFSDLHGAIAKKMVVIPNGTPNIDTLKHMNKLHLRRKYGIDIEAFVALFFGSMTFNPNHEAASYLYGISDSISQQFEKNTKRQLVFIIAGIGSDNLPETAHFVPIGFVKDLNELLSLPDAIVLPHLPSHSGPHVKTTYALLSKKPVIASEDAVKDMPDLIPKRHFLPFDINEPDELLESLIQLHCDEKVGKHLALNAYLYSKKFSWEYVTSMHFTLYEKLKS